MCDNRALWNYSLWNAHFYHQYLQEHARMTQWIQNLHQNLPQPWQNFTSHETGSHSYHNHHQLPVTQQGHYIPLQGHYIPQQGHYIPQQGHYIPQQGHYIPQQGNFIPEQGCYIPQQGQQVPHQRRSFKHRENSRYNSHYDPHYRSRSQTSAKYVSDNEIDEQEEDNENDASDSELVLNVDAILAFRATKEESEKEEDAVSEESFEFVDTVLDENFEFVGLDDAGQMQKMFGRKSAPDASGDAEYDREARIVLFGDRADRIAGLETSLEIMFDHINDLHQPVVYPHV
ncbi:unnamed protein product [Larinioides sclopetarius]|uniref:Uncharacterized protein n=1 Tax=Larinioides sclopetarius TaxID=280406 RepID=A0AAV2ADM5_9ARAC